MGGTMFGQFESGVISGVAVGVAWNVGDGVGVLLGVGVGVRVGVGVGVWVGVAVGVDGTLPIAGQPAGKLFERLATWRKICSESTELTLPLQSTSPWKCCPPCAANPAIPPPMSVHGSFCCTLSAAT
jgi:hypothetical protein